jgi:enoyl-CoA hydratase/carnithine racemase
VGRARAFEVLVSGQDFDGELAERYGYVNRAVPDEQFVAFVDAFAERVSRFDLLALADIKRFVNAATLPADEPLGAEIDAFWRAAQRPAFSALHSQGFQGRLQPAGRRRIQPRGLHRDYLGRPRFVLHPLACS